MKEISRKDGSRYFIINVLGHQNIFEIEEDAEQKCFFIESSDEYILRSIARMHSSKLLMTSDGISLVNGSQNLHEAIRIYEHLLKSDNQDIVRSSQESLKTIKAKYESLLSDKYYYLKVGDNFVYTDNGKIYPINLKDNQDYSQFKKTLKGLENESEKSQYNMGVRLSKIDEEEAIEYYKKSVAQGYVNAQYNLGCIMKKRGNIDEAIKYFKLAAEQGYIDAQYNLGCIMEKRGNIEESIKWFELAAVQGDGEALKKKEQLQEKIKVKGLEEDNIVKE